MTGAREPWLWGVVATLCATIAVSLGFAWVAHRNPDPLVVEDAYTAGLAWNGARRARARAEAEGWQLGLSARTEAGGVAVQIVARDETGEPLRGARLGLRRVRPSEGGYDVDIPVGADGTARVPLPRAGRWHLVATAERDGAVLERIFRVTR